MEFDRGRFYIKKGNGLGDLGPGLWTGMELDWGLVLGFGYVIRVRLVLSYHKDHFCNFPNLKD